VADAVIQTRALTKRYEGLDALAGLDLDVPAGSICGFLGRNGAGKTTTIRLLMGLIRPDTGTIRVNGLDPYSDALYSRRQMAYNTLYNKPKHPDYGLYYTPMLMIDMTTAGRPPAPNARRTPNAPMAPTMPAMRDQVMPRPG